MTIKRRGFLGAASLGAVAATAAPARGYDSHQGHYDRIRPTVSSGIGRGEATSLSVVWLPSPGREQLPPVKVRLVLFDLSGQRLADKEVFIAPFSGAAVDYEPPRSMKRRQVFGYGFVEGYTGQLVEELFAGLEVYDVSSGKTNIAIPPALG